MNEFQIFFAKAFQKMCASYKVGQCEFEKVEGQTDDYFVLKFALKNKIFEVYLYEEEAGFSCEGKWCLAERAAYPTDMLLFEAFKRLFEKQLNKPKPDGVPPGGVNKTN